MLQVEIPILHWDGKESIKTYDIDAIEIKIQIPYATKIDLSTLSSFSQLEKIQIINNKILTELDLSPISSCSHLRTLTIVGNDQIQKLDLKPLSALPKLHSIQIRNLASLKELDLRRLSDCKSLREFEVWINEDIKLQSLKDIARCIQLTSLVLGGNTHDLDLSALKILDNLQELRISQNWRITSLVLFPFLSAFRLRKLVVYRNDRLQDFDLNLEGLEESLEEMQISYNRMLETIDLKSLATLTQLKKFRLIRNTKLRKIDLSPLSFCSKLNDIEISENTRLRRVDLLPLLDIPIDSIDISYASTILSEESIFKKYPHWNRHISHYDKILGLYNITTIRKLVEILKDYEPCSWKVSFLTNNMTRNYDIPGIGILDIEIQDLEELLTCDNLSEVQHQVFSLYSKQIKSERTTILADIDELALTEIAAIIPTILRLRGKEIKHIKVKKTDGGKINLGPLICTAWGFQICSALGTGQFVTMKDFDRIRFEIEKLGGTITVHETGRVPYPEHISTSLQRYILKLVRDSRLREKLFQSKL
ncbi:MAG: leucine-rich repeat protein [Candidatus Lokiarchaeota archaeon]|nr:leucine-rich repeat protein [Candidatus Lokiarchaeota archaeon]